MFILALIGWAAIAVGGFAAWAGYSENHLLLIAMGLSSAISGVLFLALERGISLLSEIRDAVAGAPSKKKFDAASYDEALLEDE